MCIKIHNISVFCIGKNNGFPILDFFGYLKNTHKNPKFGRVRQIPIWELGWEFPDWDLSHFTKFGIFEITCPRVDMNFIFEWSTRYLTSEISS